MVFKDLIMQSKDGTETGTLFLDVREIEITVRDKVIIGKMYSRHIYTNDNKLYYIFSTKDYCNMKVGGTYLVNVNIANAWKDNEHDGAITGFVRTVKESI